MWRVMKLVLLCTLLIYYIIHNIIKFQGYGTINFETVISVSGLFVMLSIVLLIVILLMIVTSLIIKLFLKGVVKYSGIDFIKKWLKPFIEGD